MSRNPRPLTRPASRKDYEIAVICALQIESDAVEAMFDEDWEKEIKYPKPQKDDNEYRMGRIGVHNVVLAYLPGIGKANTAKLASSFSRTFPEIRLGLVVGICGGVPFIREHHSQPRERRVFLGDIIISTQVLQYDLGHQYSNELKSMDTLANTLGRPKDEIRSFVRGRQGFSGRRDLENRTCRYLEEFSEIEGFEKPKYQGVEKDILYKSDYRHKHHDSKDCDCAKREDIVCQTALDSTCEELKCASEQSVRRIRSEEVENKNNAVAPRPRIHFGPVASGDSVVKSTKHRDELAESKDVIGFEMEGAGAWESMPIVVMKSVVDYADSHKSYLWQTYGTACAAACMKAFMSQWRPTERTLPSQQPEAGTSAYSLPERETGESSGATGEKSKTQSKSDDIIKHEMDVDKAYALLQSPPRSTANLEAALQILLKAEVEKERLDSSLRRRIYWGLMAVEKELSGSPNFLAAKKREHINQAQQYLVEVRMIVRQSSNASLDAQVSLEQHIIDGRKAILDLSVRNDVEELKRSKSKAKAGIDASLRKLQEIDPKSYDNVVEAAKEWHEKFSS